MATNSFGIKSNVRTFRVMQNETTTLRNLLESTILTGNSSLVISISCSDNCEQCDDNKQRGKPKLPAPFS
jgi:hypothetical protein